MIHVYLINGTDKALGSIEHVETCGSGQHFVDDSSKNICMDKTLCGLVQVSQAQLSVCYHQLS